MELLSKTLLDIITDADQLMGTFNLYMLGEWINNATNWATNEQEKELYIYNAIN